MKKTEINEVKMVWDDEEITGEATIFNGELVGVEIYGENGICTFKVGKGGLGFVRAVYDACAEILLESSAEVGSAEDGGVAQ